MSKDENSSDASNGRLQRAALIAEVIGGFAVLLTRPKA